MSSPSNKKYLFNHGEETTLNKMDPPSIGPMLPLLQINLTLQDLDFGNWDEYPDLEVGMR